MESANRKRSRLEYVNANLKGASAHAQYASDTVGVMMQMLDARTPVNGALEVAIERIREARQQADSALMYLTGLLGEWRADEPVP